MAFNPRVDLTAELFALFKLGPGMWHPIVEKALTQRESKYRDLEWLTSVIFYLNHPERQKPDGYFIPIDPASQPASVAEYKDWREKISALISVVRFNPIEFIRVLITQPLVLIDHPAHHGKHLFQSAFQVHLKLNPRLSAPELYEYRQMIRGGIWAQTGTWDLGPWTPTAAWENLSPTVWAIPPSSASSLAFGATALPSWLYDYAWKEDGVVATPNRFYGHRGEPAFPTAGGERDQYKPRQRDGHEYYLGDRPSLGPLNFSVGTKIKYKLQFKGMVVRFDEPPSSRNRKLVEVVKSTYWQLDFDKTLTQAAPVQYK